jgi:hypothetical protein
MHAAHALLAVVRRSTLRLALSACALAFTLAAPCAAKNPAPQHSDLPAIPAPYTRIGIVTFLDDSRINNGGKKFTEVLLGRLGARINGVEFVLADPQEIGVKAGPLQPDEACNLGAKLGVQALLDGIFSGVDIVGGTWPSIANNVPQAKGTARWRLLDAGTGMLMLDGRVEPEKPKLYSRRVRSTDDLVRLVMLDMAEEIGQALADGGAVPDDAPADAGPKPAAKTQAPSEGQAK